MSEQDHLNLKPCPFCNVLGSPALGRVVCWECGNAGPSDDPTGAKWNSLAAAVQLGKVAPKLAEALRYLEDWLDNQWFGCQCDTPECTDGCYLATAKRALAEYDALTTEQKS